MKYQLFSILKYTLFEELWMHFIKIYWLLYPALPKHLPMRTLYLIAALAQIPNTSAAKITFCQMQQLCSFTSMSSAQSLQLLWPVSLFPSQSFSLRKWWTICLLCLFRSQLFKSALTLLRPFVKKTEHAFSNSLHKNCRTCVVFFSPCNFRQPDTTSYCLRFPVFNFGSTHRLF